MYDKFPKILNTSFNPFFGLNFAFYAVASSNTDSGMANSVDPDQTAPSGTV